ncbi:hypothetical protein LguiA_005856 [Lonicera macranthoides]
MILIHVCHTSVLYDADSGSVDLSDISKIRTKVESGTIAFNIGSRKLTSSSKDQSDNVLHRPHELQSERFHNDVTSDNLHSATHLHLYDGESSFSILAFRSGHITYLGPIPFFGSISLRSDSSTTSTRSFAFPV